MNDEAIKRICNKCFNLCGIDNYSEIPSKLKPPKKKFFCHKVDEKTLIITFQDKTHSLAFGYCFENSLDNSKFIRLNNLLEEVNYVLPILRLNDKELLDYQEAIWSTANEKTICSTIGNSLSKITLFNLVQKFKRWSQKTYEGKKMPFAVIIKPEKSSSDNGFDFIKFLDNNFCATFTDGKNTVAELTADGKLIRHTLVSFSYAKTDNDDSKKIEFSTINYIPLANICTGNTIGIALTPCGQILILKNRKIQYAYQKSKWVYYDSDKFVSEAYKIIELPTDEPGSGDSKTNNILYKHIFSDILELSLTGTGGLIAVLNNVSDAQKTFKCLTDMSGEKKIQEKKKYATNAICGKKYVDINRSIRKELLSLDGAMIINTLGEIIACGEIVRVGIGESTGGARTKAAKELSQYGIAIKISEDGNVECYKAKECYYQF